MEYDFSRPTDRRGTDSYKWDSAPEADIIPLWVADMDFETFPAITEALQRRVAHGIFGYTRVPEAYYEAVCRWFKKRHGWHINREDIIYTSGVVPAVSAVIKALTLPGDQVIVQGPVYNCFFSSIRNNGCEMVSNSLIYNKEELRYEIDFDDLERKLKHERARLMLLCNPHNPGGRVWTRDELTRVAELCRKYGVRVVSDEIHCELTLYDNEYVPFGSLPDELSRDSITCCSPSKAFNTAGLQIANIVCRDAEVRNRIDRAININEVCDVNPFGVIALQAAYSDEGYEWLTQLRKYISANYDLLLERFARELPKCKVMRMEGTYLAWIDCSELHIPSDEIEEMLMHENKVWVNAGSMYGAEGAAFIRINMACTSELLNEGITRIVNGLGDK
ncbi:MAG: MalY/PatB family protein [Prevotella sp.]|uniref:MalY/PatB family protein n=1 Tax=Leyella stercorea TaxID=363265 RepID=UPI0025CD1E46|nr:pyridoxal phosphate-dependent aminotransferase [Prevotella sp.]MDD7720491.1 pyridoxal phosphate-dependent aminotransferase [Leyella stercorea]MDY4198167.1 MalY/PatB family protein [Prevotella sp.]